MTAKGNWRSYLPCSNEALAKELLGAFKKHFSEKYPVLKLKIQKGGAEDRWWLIGDDIINLEAADLDLFFSGFMAGAVAYQKIKSPWGE